MTLGFIVQQVNHCRQNFESHGENHHNFSHCLKKETDFDWPIMSTCSALGYYLRLCID